MSRSQNLLNLYMDMNRFVIVQRQVDVQDFKSNVYEDEREGPDHRCGPKVVRGPMNSCGPKLPSLVIYLPKLSYPVLKNKKNPVFITNFVF